MPQPARHLRRRPASVLAVAVAVSVLVSLVAAPTAQARTRTSAARATHAARLAHTPASRQAQASNALSTAERALSARTPAAQRPDTTLALRRLWLLRGSLAPADRATADRLLARPNKSSSSCTSYVCVHWNPSEVSSAWPTTVANVVDHVAATYRAAGYRKPEPDGSVGGNAQTDIYIDQLPPGLYGYCTTDQQRYHGHGRHDVWAFCVLDNDYAGFPAHTPLENLEVTAAHEFYHAVQFAYDYSEDPWFMEATAAWVEDQMYTTVNDNLQYLADSPITHPKKSMDKFGGVFHYGVWIFFRYLTEHQPARKGALPVLLLKMWQAADSKHGKKHDRYSVQAIDKVLHKKAHTSLAHAFAKFSDANLRTHTEYSEGAANNYPSKRFANGKLLKRRGQSASFSTRLNHLTSASYAYVTKVSKGTKAHLRLSFTLGKHSSVAVVSTYKRNGKVKTKLVHLRKGHGHIKVAFASSSVVGVAVTLVNGATSYKCGHHTAYSCGGQPLDQHVREKVKATVVK